MSKSVTISPLFRHNTGIRQTDGQTDGIGKTVSRSACIACWRAIRRAVILSAAQAIVSITKEDFCSGTKSRNVRRICQRTQVYLLPDSLPEPPSAESCLSEAAIRPFATATQRPAAVNWAPSVHWTSAVCRRPRRPLVERTWTWSPITSVEWEPKRTRSAAAASSYWLCFLQASITH